MEPEKNTNKTGMIIGILVLVVIIGLIVMAGGNDKDMDENMDTTTDTTVQEEGVMVGGAMMLPSQDIVTNAMNADNVTTLVAAVDAAGLVETLQGPGPFTVFAPTNDAFDDLPEGTVDTLLMPENVDDLTSVLTYHVVPGVYTAADLTDGLELETVNGATILFTVENGVLMINGSAMVETADVISSNGVTHVIDTVLTPQA